MPNPHAVYLEAVAKAKKCETSQNYLDSPALLPSELKKRRKNLFSRPSITAFSNNSEGRASDAHIERTLSATSLDNLVEFNTWDSTAPYAYFIRVVDASSGSKSESFNPDEILETWLAQYKSDSGPDAKKPRNFKYLCTFTHNLYV